MSVAIHFEANVSVSETTKRASPRAARNEFTAVTRSDSCASRLAAALGLEPGRATSRQAVRAAQMRLRGCGDVTSDTPFNGQSATGVTVLLRFGLDDVTKCGSDACPVAKKMRYLSAVAIHARAVGACEYTMLLAIRVEYGIEITRLVVGVGALFPGEQRSFTFAVEAVAASGYKAVMRKR